MRRRRRRIDDDLNALAVLRLRLRGATVEDGALATASAASDLLDADGATVRLVLPGAPPLEVVAGRATPDGDLVPVRRGADAIGTVAVHGARRPLTPSVRVVLELVADSLGDLTSLPPGTAAPALVTASQLLASARPGDVVVVLEAGVTREALTAAVASEVRSTDLVAPLDTGVVVLLDEPRAPAEVVAHRLLRACRARLGPSVVAGGALLLPGGTPVDAVDEARRLLRLGVAAVAAV